MQKKSKIISIADFNAEKRKDKELIYYNEQLSKLNLSLIHISEPTRPY